MRKIRKKFKRPRVSWESMSIKENKAIESEYGLRRKKEILISQEILRGYRQRARLLIAEKDEQKEKVLKDKMMKLGILSADAKGLDDILALDVRNVLDRRLQTIIFRKGLATSPMHARQMITHGHIRIDGRKVAFPSYIVPVKEESQIECSQVKPKPVKPKKVAEKAGDDVSKDAPPEGEANEEKEGDAKTQTPEEAASRDNKKESKTESPESREKPEGEAAEEGKANEAAEESKK